MRNAVSVDGRIDWFPADIDLFYELDSRWQADTHLVGSNTLLSSEDSIPKEDETAFQKPQNDPSDIRSLLVIPDS